MAQSTMAIIILATAVVLYCTAWIPLYITSILAAIAMVLCGIIDFDMAFSSLGSSTIMLLIGMQVIGKAIVEVGIGDVLGKRLVRVFHGSQRAFVLSVCAFIMLASMFINGLVMMTIMMCVVDCICAQSGGRLQRKTVYLPMAITSIYGCAMTSIGATSMMNVSAQLAVSEFGRGLRLFEPAVVTLPGALAALIFAATVGQRISRRRFDFEDTGAPSAPLPGSEEKTYCKWRIALTCAVFAAALVFLIAEIIPYGATAMIAACILIMTGCASPKALNEISWSTVFLIAGSIGIGAGVSASGAGKIIAGVFIKICGPLGQSPYLMCCFVMLITTVMSNFMSNNGAVTVMCPLAFAIASDFGVSLLPFALACGCGANLSVSTPVACGNVSVTTVAGYRFKDYLLYGGIINLLAYFACCASLYFAFFA